MTYKFKNLDENLGLKIKIDLKKIYDQKIKSE